ncbi:hypothetical protein BJ912DRAFT_103606 [Pholiota molesta]|nr:hypothetical protein BJ912DRAFT_103606 [Pholiota molesta]
MASRRLPTNTHVVPRHTNTPPTTTATSRRAAMPAHHDDSYPPPTTSFRGARTPRITMTARTRATSSRTASCAGGLRMRVLALSSHLPWRTQAQPVYRYCGSSKTMRAACTAPCRGRSSSCMLVGAVHVGAAGDHVRHSTPWGSMQGGSASTMGV